MIYQYRCERCDKSFDVVKSAHDFNRDEFCNCGAVAQREFVPSRLSIFKSKGIAESAEYNPGLGCVVRNKSHRAELCKIKGVEEIGNEKPETLHKYFDEKRQENRDKVYDEAIKGHVGNCS